MIFTVIKRLIKERKEYIQGKLILTEHNLWNVDIGDVYINLNLKSNQLITGKGYIYQNNEFIKFIGDKMTNYSINKNYFRYKDGDIVKGTIKNNEFIIKS
jgi:hypothetical protein